MNGSTNLRYVLGELVGDFVERNMQDLDLPPTEWHMLLQDIAPCHCGDTCIFKIAPVTPFAHARTCAECNNLTTCGLTKICMAKNGQKVVLSICRLQMSSNQGCGEPKLEPTWLHFPLARFSLGLSLCTASLCVFSH